MSVLLKKLFRTIWNTRGQFLAVTAVVAVGITVYIAMNTSYYNLNRSRDEFYRDNNFADYYFHVVRAPEQVTRQIESLPGVAAVNGRLQKDVPLVKENNQKATARITSYPVPMAGINRIQLLSGRIFERYPQGGGVEVLVDSRFFTANRLSFNDTISIVAEGREVPLTVVGTGTGPEFTFAMKDAATLIPDPETFGLVMMPLNQAQQALNLPGQINQVVIKLSPGADEEEVAGRVKALLEPYGNLSSYPLKKQLSHAVLQGELDGLKAISGFMPFIFLSIAAAIQIVMLGRMIRGQRLQIGIMKALGYNSRQIITYYTTYSMSSSLLGALLGTAAGIGLASVISGAYADVFNLPRAIGGVNTTAVINGLALSLAVGAAAGLPASRRVVSINPAEAMRPEPPKNAGRVFLERLPRIWGLLESTWKMSQRTALSDLELRNAEENYRRTQELFRTEAVSRVEYEKALLQVETLRQDMEEQRSLLESSLAQVESLGQTLQQLSAKEKQLLVTSPAGGAVLSLPVEAGQVLNPGSLLATVAAPDSLEVKADILSDDLAEVSEGQKVNITAPVLGSRSLTGRVKQIYPRAEEKMSALGVSQRRVPVIISLDEAANLKPGFEVKVSVLTRHSDLLVPLESVITRADGQKEVMVVVNNRIARRTINTGISDREKVEITGGLQAGDVLIRDGSQALPDKARVKPEKS